MRQLLLPLLMMYTFLNVSAQSDQDAIANAVDALHTAILDGQPIRGFI